MDFEPGLEFEGRVPLEPPTLSQRAGYTRPLAWSTGPLSVIEARRRDGCFFVAVFCGIVARYCRRVRQVEFRLKMRVVQCCQCGSDIGGVEVSHMSARSVQGPT